MAIPLEMMSYEIKTSVDYLNYLAKSKGNQPAKGRGKGLLTKKGVEVVMEKIKMVWVLKKKRTETVIEETGQSEEKDSDEENLDHSKKLKGIETLSAIAQFMIDMKKSRKASKDDFILQQRHKGSVSTAKPTVVLLEENSSYCSRLQLPVLNQSVNTDRITAVGEKVNAVESLLVVSTELEDLRVEFNKSEFNLANYKRGLASVEERLVFYKNNEVIFTDQIAVLKSDASFNEAEIIALKSYIEKLKKEKEDNLLKINNYDNATKSLDKVIGSQLVDNNKKGLGYNAVPPPPTGLFAPPIIDLSHSGIEKFKEPDDDEDDKPKPKVVKKIVESKTIKQDVVSNGKLKKKTVFPTAAKIEVVKPKQQEKLVRKPVKYAEMYRSQKPRGNQRNWNNQKSHQLGSDFVMNNKACFACGSFNHLIKDCKRKVQKPIWNNARRVNHHNSHRMSYPHPKRNFVPKAVLMKTGMRPVNAAKPKAAYNAVKRNRFNVVKASACWVWMPKNRVVDHVSKNISASVTLKRLDYIDAQGRFKWMHKFRGGKSAAKKKKNPEKSATKAERPKRRSVWKNPLSKENEGLILEIDDLETIEELTTAGYRVTTAGSRLLLLRVESSKDQESLGNPEDASKQGRSIADIDADVEVTLVDETQVRQNDDLIFDTGVLDDDEMPVEAKVDGKDEQSTKPNDSTAGEIVTTASIEVSVVPTTIKEITLAQTLIQIKKAKPKVVAIAATTTTTTRPKARG
ncbi:ribonuclease H-like domain-containing protein [Tanacetum coccineum]